MTSYLTFRLGARELAAPLTQVREVVRAEGVTAISGVRAPVTGLLELRGNPLPVVDLRTLHDAEELGDVIVIADADEGALGVAVDKVTAVVTPDALASGDGLLPVGLPGYVTEVLRATDDHRVVLLVDLRVLAGIAAPAQPSRA